MTVLYDFALPLGKKRQWRKQRQQRLRLMPIEVPKTQVTILIER